MTVDEILSLCRIKLDDTVAPYLWSDSELIIYLNWAYNKFCKKTHILKDVTTSAVVDIPLLSNVSTYTLSPYIVEITSAILDSSDYPLTEISQERMDAQIPDWKNDSSGHPLYFITDYGTEKLRIQPYFGEDGGYDAGEFTKVGTFASGDSSVTISTGFTVAGYDDGDEIDIDGTTNNDGKKTISTVTDTKIVFTSSIIAEVGVSTTFRKVEDYIRLSVIRLPITALALATRLTQSPEINADYHFGLVHGVLHQAYMKPDTQTLNLTQAADEMALFMEDINEARIELLSRRSTREVFYAHSGNI